MGPVNRDLLCFNSIVKALQRTLRNLFEMLALNMCLNDEVKKDRDDYLKIALSLPFHKDATTALGVIAKSYLEALADSTVNVSSPTSPTHPTAEDKENSSSNGDRAKSKEEVMKMLEAKFDFVKDVREDLNRGLTFWNQLVHAVKKLREHKLVTEEVAGQFKAADAWLNTRV
ncbi:temperature dependent protein affecting M2 dsRNA replication [Paraphysoderma sedebokerense]|nr:temperature dependent protein affecting M2 dsRNA replication [Paraphysoderma sedebokerense]